MDAILMEEGGAAVAATGMVACVFFAIFSIIGLAAFAFWIWMLIDVIKKCPSADNKKVIWVLVVIFLGIIGAAVYYFVQRPKNPAVVSGPPAA